jgi:uncharacterized FlaG/YvyC family protein
MGETLVQIRDDKRTKGAIPEIHTRVCQEEEKTGRFSRIQYESSSKCTVVRARESSSGRVVREEPSLWTFMWVYLRLRYAHITCCIDIHRSVCTTSN